MYLLLLKLSCVLVLCVWNSVIRWINIETYLPPSSELFSCVIIILIIFKPHKRWCWDSIHLCLFLDSSHGSSSFPAFLCLLSAIIVLEQFFLTLALKQFRLRWIIAVFGFLKTCLWRIFLFSIEFLIGGYTSETETCGIIVFWVPLSLLRIQAQVSLLITLARVICLFVCFVGDFLWFCFVPFHIWML